MVLVTTPPTMEVTTAVAGQITQLPFQIGAASSSDTQVQQGATTGCSPFMAILQSILQTNMGQAGLEEMADNPTNLAIFENVPGASLLSQVSSVSGNCPQAQEGADAKQNSIMAILQKIQQTNEAQAAPKELADQLLCLLQALAGPKSIQESDKPNPGTDSTEDTQKRSIEQAILVALGRPLQPKWTAVVDKGENKTEGEGVDSDGLTEKDESAEKIRAEILTVLFPLEESATANGASGLPKMKGAAREDGDSGNAFAPESQEAQDRRLGGPVGASTVGIVIGPLADKTPSGLDADEKISQSADNSKTSQPTTEPAASHIIGAAGALSVETINQSTNTGASEPTEEKNVTQQGKVIEVDSPSKKPQGADEAAQAGVPLKNEEGVRTTKHEPFDDAHRAAINTMEQNVGKSSNDGAVGQNAPGNHQGEDGDSARHAKVLYSRFQAANDGTQQAVPSREQTTSRATQGVATKVSEKIESLLGKAEPQILKLDASSESQSFAKGEGDSHQLGQSFGGQGVIQKTSTETGDVSPFGSIVADRIARMTEHVAQTNRSDLTLRLKIDGSESVLLEMKERAGVIVIGIQCQDKALAKALENQKETMFRNLETKNLNTSISVTNIGEDEQDGQKERQKNRREQNRDNWNGRQMGSSSYFETLI
jgi:hypothetical protein